MDIEVGSVWTHKNHQTRYIITGIVIVNTGNLWEHGVRYVSATSNKVEYVRTKREFLEKFERRN